MSHGECEDDTVGNPERYTESTKQNPALPIIMIATVMTRTACNILTNQNKSTNNQTMATSPALIFGISGDQGREVARGLLAAGGYGPIFGVTSSLDHVADPQSIPDGVQLMQVDLGNKAKVKKALLETKATAIFLVTTTDLPPESSAMGSLKEAEEFEYDAIVSFFDTLVEAHKHDDGGLTRHVVFSCLDDVEAIVAKAEDCLLDIKPLDDGSTVPHYSGKGRAGSYALRLLESMPDLSVTLLTLPFLHSNFLASAIPLPNEGQTQWTISACLGDAKIDMFSVSDLAYIVPKLLEAREIYDGYNVKVSAEKISMEEVAETFADLFGKDCIYNPLTVEEMASMDIPGADAFGQMCQFLASPFSSHDVGVTETIMFPRKPQLFKDWLLTHSDHPAFEKVGLAMDAPDILEVTVFGATGMQGSSVVRGLLADTRKEYKIRATTRNVDSEKAKAIKELDPERITLVKVNFDDVKSCEAALDGADGAFLVTDYYSAGCDPKVEEQHARNVIDAAEASHTVRHLIFSCLESIEEMNKELKLGLDNKVGDDDHPLSQFDAKARAASYARTKKISVTYVLMPLYAENFFNMMADEEVDEKNDETPLMCMSIDDLGPCVANIFDSYQCYAGHEVGLVTNIVTIREAAEMIKEVFDMEVDDSKDETKEATKGEQWVEQKQTFAKDLGSMFEYYSKTDAVKKRRSIAKTMELVPDAKPLKQWLEDNRDNVEFRAMLGLR